jgi:uncharacterized protein involved in type VI secretion and phage assembly
VSQEWLEQSVSESSERNPPLPGVAPAIVIENIDVTGQGRVQVELPWLSEVKPWARIASPSAGSGRGLYLIPQIGDEVLIAFAHGDLREPYVIGSLWNQSDLPPYTTPEAPRSYRALQTPIGHQLEFDDIRQTITLKTSAGQKIEMGPTEISISTQEGMAAIKLGVDGTITITAQNAIKFEALNEISFSGMNVKIDGGANVQIKAGAICEFQGGLVKIN